MVVSVFGGGRNLFQAIEAGAIGYLLKGSLPDDFNASIRALQAGESPISPALARLLLRLRPAASRIEGFGLYLKMRQLSFCDVVAASAQARHALARGTSASQPDEFDPKCAFSTSKICPATTGLSKWWSKPAPTVAARSLTCP